MIRTMAITPLSIVLRGGWRVAGRATAVERVLCFRIGFDTGQRSQASAGWYISAFDVTAGKMSYSQLRNQFQAKNSMIFGLSHTHGCTKYSYFADQKHNPAPRAYHQLLTFIIDYSISRIVSSFFAFLRTSTARALRLLRSVMLRRPQDEGQVRSHTSICTLINKQAMIQSHLKS